MKNKVKICKTDFSQTIYRKKNVKFCLIIKIAQNLQYFFKFWF